MKTMQKHTNSPSKPEDTYSPTKEFFNFLFKKRIGKAWGWTISKLDTYLSDDAPLDGRVSRVAAQDNNGDFSFSQLGGWGSATVAGLKMLLMPFKKVYQYIRWQKDPTRKKPTFTATDAFYLTIDIALFALTVTAAAFASSFIAVILGFAAAVVTVIAGVAEFVQAWRNSRGTTLNSTISQSHYFSIAKRTLSLALPGLGLAAAGLVLLGTLLGPVGAPLVMVGLGIGVGVAVLSAGLWVAQRVDNYLVRKAHQRKIESCLLKGSFDDEPDLTLSEKISRMFEIQRFLSENTHYDDKKYFRFFKNAALVMALKNDDYREQFKDRVHNKQGEVSRELLKERPLSEKKEIPLDVIVDHVIAHPEYAKNILSKRYGTTLFGRRNFRKELSQRVDLVLKLKAAATENPELHEASLVSKLENSRHFKKHRVAFDEVRSEVLRFGIH